MSNPAEPTEPTEPALPEPGEILDPDVAAASGELDRERAAEQADALRTDELLPEERLTEYEPPDRPSPPTAEGITETEERAGETIDDRIAQEEPDVGSGPPEDTAGDEQP